MSVPTPLRTEEPTSSNSIPLAAVFGQIMTVLIALEFSHTLQYLVSRDQGIIQTKIVMLIGLLALAPSLSSSISKKLGR